MGTIGPAPPRVLARHVPWRLAISTATGEADGRQAAIPSLPILQSRAARVRVPARREPRFLGGFGERRRVRCPACGHEDLRTPFAPAEPPEGEAGS